MDPRDSPAPLRPPPPPRTFIDAAPNPAAAGSPFGPAQYGGGSQLSPAKKRGRPRKYSLGGGGVATSPADSVAPVGPTGGTPTSETSAKRSGRPPGTGKKQLTATGSFGVNFTPHVIMVEVGEYVGRIFRTSKITWITEDEFRQLDYAHLDDFLQHHSPDGSSQLGRIEEALMGRKYRRVYCKRRV